MKILFLKMKKKGMFYFIKIQITSPYSKQLSAFNCLSVQTTLSIYQRAVIICLVVSIGYVSSTF